MITSFSRGFMVLAIISICLACTTDDECSLNGFCTPGTGVCVCDKPWVDDSCSLIDVLPVDPATHPGAAVYGYAPNVSSWGGSILKGDDGQHHLFVAQMKTGGLIGWGSQSECVHAVSKSPDGECVLCHVS